MQSELSELLERDVDLFTPASINPHVKETVWAGAEVIYAVDHAGGDD